MAITLKAITPEGFGGADYYRETVQIENRSQIRAIRMAFAMKYHVMLDLVEVEEI